MIAQPKNRVHAIKSKFENLNKDSTREDTSDEHLFKQIPQANVDVTILNKENVICNTQYDKRDSKYESLDNSCNLEPNASYLYTKSDLKTGSDVKKLLTRQSSDPGKKLHRSHAFRCDRSKVISPKRHGSCYGKPESSEFKMERRLPKDKLKKLSNFIEDQMKKDGVVNSSNAIIVGEVKEINSNNAIIVGEVKEINSNNATMVGQVKEINIPFNSIPDTEVPKHILDQYAKVVKPKNNDLDKKEGMTDSGVSSENEEQKNVFEEEVSNVKRLTSQFENPVDSNLDQMNNLCASIETIKLEKKNPNLKLTNTLKKALKQPLPVGPPPKKPPRIFIDTLLEKEKESPARERKDTKRMLEKLELALQKRENTLKTQTLQTVKKEPKEIHYLCTEILDITHRTLLPNSVNNCLKSLNCAVTNNSTLSLPYTSQTNRPLLCSCSSGDLTESTIFNTRCPTCNMNNGKNHEFKCHLKCKCREEASQFFVDEPIYDEPCVDVSKEITNHYGTLNQSKSMEELRRSFVDDQKIYDVPCDTSRPDSPESPTNESLKETPENPEITENPEIPPNGIERLKNIFEKNNSENENEKKIEVKTATDFQKLRKSFEKIDVARMSVNSDKGNGNTEDRRTLAKPPTRPKPVFVKNNSKSSENLHESAKEKEKRFSTEGRRFSRDRSEERRSSWKAATAQIDVDRENLNQLMTEIYETVGVACSMAHSQDAPPKFPLADSTSEDSVKLTRSLTEKRKNYVRRVASRVAYLDTKQIKDRRSRNQTTLCSYQTDQPYITFRSWKSFRTSQNNLKMELDSTDCLNHSELNNSNDSKSIDEKTGCVEIELPFVPRERGLFNVCLLVGLNYLTGEAYVKSVFPAQVQVPTHIENLIFPETLSANIDGPTDARAAQCYSLVLTDETGERSYGYCRRVLPEGTSECLPLCYCLIGKYRAPGFYYKVLQEIESHHGRSDQEIHSILQQLFETDFPNPGEHITLSTNETHQTNANKSKTLPDMRSSSDYGKSDYGKSDYGNSDYGKSDIDRSDSDNNNSVSVFLDLERPRMKLLKRPIDPRADDNNLSILLDSLGAGLTVKIFGSLLLERKVLICGNQLSQVSSCMEALQMSLYPFVWQQPLISVIPHEIEREVLEAPLPMLAGILRTAGPVEKAPEEGMLIDLSHSSKVLFCQGDEATILPAASFKTLKTALQMEYKKDREDTKMRNVMISEAFLRFFVDILGDFWKYFSVGELTEGAFGRGNIIFDKNEFIKNTTSKQNQYFLEWFTETAIFNHFISNMAALQPDSCQTDVSCQSNVKPRLVDTPLPDFYDLFNERVKSRRKSEGNTKFDKSNYKNAMNKRMRLLKTKLRELVA